MLSIAMVHSPLMGYFIVQGQLFNRLHTSTGVTFVENYMSSDLSAYRRHSTIPFHHSIPPFQSSDCRLPSMETPFPLKLAVMNQWTVPLEWNGGMEYWNDP